MSDQLISLNDDFADIAAAVKDIAMWERHRIFVIEHLVLTGNARDPGSIEIGSWLRRAKLLSQAEEIFALLVRHEDQVRALDPRLSR
ncbi:hypothetical protein [Bradyrhizobium sp.]|uniref:hypothetical protein n=1 Tax=Bradyrhizobium sp. TaxID=376 RepID=UPI0039E2BA8A